MHYTDSIGQYFSPVLPRSLFCSPRSVPTPYPTPGPAHRHRAHALPLPPSPSPTDYAVVLSGTIMMGTTDGTRTPIKQGGVIVQLGAQHDWQNETDEWCRKFSPLVRTSMGARGVGR